MNGQLARLVCISDACATTSGWTWFWLFQENGRVACLYPCVLLRNDALGLSYSQLFFISLYLDCLHFLSTLGEGFYPTCYTSISSGHFTYYCLTLFLNLFLGIVSETSLPISFCYSFSCPLFITVRVTYSSPTDISQIVSTISFSMV